MVSPNREYFSACGRGVQIGALVALFVSYEIATVLSLLYDHRDGSTTGGFAWLAILIAAVYYEVYRRFPGQDRWVFAVFVSLAAAAIILTGILFDAGSLIGIWER
ncbi:MAG: hypothetical protein IT364_26350 [Candidatus Hydrogenedentes bacterium]|nr:hypothetical protein [Candidatus Hydrogenedentota bacterium]